MVLEYALYYCVYQTQTSCYKFILSLIKNSYNVAYFIFDTSKV